MAVGEPVVVASALAAWARGEWVSASVQASALELVQAEALERSRSDSVRCVRPRR